MSVISWSQPPRLDVPVSLPALPALPDTTDSDSVLDYFDNLQTYLQAQNQALEALSVENAEQREFLTDILDSIKELDRDSINGLSAVTGTAGAAYTATEQAMLTSLKTTLNSLLTYL